MDIESLPASNNISDNSNDNSLSKENTSVDDSKAHGIVYDKNRSTKKKNPDASKMISSLISSLDNLKEASME